MRIPTMYGWLSVVLLLGSLLGCADDEGTSGDCRNAAQACADGFVCSPSAAGLYACEPDVDASASSGSDVGLTDPDLEDVGLTESDAADNDATSSPDLDAALPISPDANRANTSPDAAVGEDLGASSTPMNTPSLLKNFPDDCQRASLIGPVLPSEANHFAAVTLSPTSYPYRVDRILYDLVTAEDTPTCTGALAHEVHLIVMDSLTTPPADPALSAVRFRSYAVDASPTSVAGRTIDLTLPTPLILESGQHLAISVQLASEGDRHLCLGRCEDSDAQPMTEWWSNAADVPYAWQDLIVDFGFKGVMLGRAVGVQL